MDFKPLPRDNIHKTLINIASVSKKLHTVLGQATVAGSLQAVGARTRLDKIINTSRAILSRSLETNISLGSHLEDWIYSKEPDMCLHILSDMERLMMPDLPVSGKTWWNQFCNAILSMYPEDKINEAIKLFDDRKGFFDFLVTEDVWGYGTYIPPQPELVAGRVLRNDPSDYDSDIMFGGTNASTTAGVDWQESSTLYSVPREREGISMEYSHPEGQNNEDIDTHKTGSPPRMLDGLSCNEKHAEAISLYQPGTCTWLVETDQYREWRNSNDSFLWLQGKAGSGKTVLTAFVIEAINKTLQEEEYLAFFYCDFRHEASTSAATIIQSILSQLLRNLRNRAGQDDVAQQIDSMTTSQSKGNSSLKHAQSIASAVSDTARFFARQPIVVIDALDECHDIENLLIALRELANGGMRLFVTSRPLQIIKDRFHGLSSNSMEIMVAAVSADIALHVRREIEGDRRLRILYPALKDEICSKLQFQAGGMFRWVQLQIDTLKKCATAREIRTALTCLPTGLEETYERILCAIDPQSSEGNIAMRALVWMVAALRPLQLTEVLEALAIDIKERKLDRDFAPVHGHVLLDALGSLVFYNEGNDIINLSHFSVKEYLVGSLIRRNLPEYHIDLPAAHAQVFRLCMCYPATLMNQLPLSNIPSDYSDSNFSDFDSIPHDTQQRTTSSMLQAPLLHYVFFHSFDHLKQVLPGGEVLNDIVALRSDIRCHPDKWAYIHSELSRYPSFDLSHLGPTHDFIVYSLIALLPETFLQEFLRHEPFEAFNGTNPLIYAVHLGKFKHAETLLSGGIRVDHPGLDIASSYEVLPLEVAFYLCDGSFFDLFLMDWMAIVPERLFSAIFCRQCRVRYDTHAIAKLLQCNEFPEWVLENEGSHTNLLLLCLFDGDQDQLLEWTEEDLLAVLRRFIQVGCDLSTPQAEPFKLVLRVVLYAISQGYTAVLQLLDSYNVPMPSRALLSQETTLVQHAFQGLDSDMCSVMNNGDRALQRTRGKCKYGSSCWSAGCNLCSLSLNFRAMDAKKYVPVDIIFVGRSGAGKSSLVNMMTCVPEGLSSAAEVPNTHSGGTSQIVSYAAPPFGVSRSQIWDTPGFAKTSDGQQIRTEIDGWLTHVSSSRCKRDLVVNDDLYLISPIIQVVWCMNASEIDDPIVWQQFRDVSETFRCRRSPPTLLIVINQTMQHSNADRNTACENQLRQLGLPTSSYLLTIRRNRGMLSPEYEDDSLALGQLIHQHISTIQCRYLQIRLDSLPVSSHHTEIGGLNRLYQCAWVISPLQGICGYIVRGSNLAEHLRVSHGITGRDTISTCRWAGCDRRAAKKCNMFRHIRERHLAWNLKVRFDLQPPDQVCSSPWLHFGTSLEEVWMTDVSSDAGNHVVNVGAWVMQGSDERSTKEEVVPSPVSVRVAQDHFAVEIPLSPGTGELSWNYLESFTPTRTGTSSLGYEESTYKRTILSPL